MFNGVYTPDDDGRRNPPAGGRTSDAGLRVGGRAPTNVDVSGSKGAAALTGGRSVRTSEIY